MNPSVADVHSDDSTVARCQSFPRRWGSGSIFVANTFAYRFRVRRPREQISENAAAVLRHPKPAEAESLDVRAWVTGSFDFAKSAVSTVPTSEDNDPSVKLSPRLNAPYRSQAKRVANEQIILAGYRLANLPNTKLK